MAAGFDSPSQAAKKFRAVADEFAKSPKQIANDSAFAVKKSVQTQLRIAAPKGRLNVGKKGSRVGVRYTLFPTSAKVFMFGPAQLIEFDTSPHRIPRETVGRGRRRRANKALIDIPGIGVRAYAMHPGTKGKHPWSKGLALGLPKCGPAAARVVHKVFEGVFG